MMISYAYAEIENVMIHHVAGKSGEGANRFSTKPVALDEMMRELLGAFFFTSFKGDTLYTFSPSAMEQTHSVCSIARAFFHQEKTIEETSKELAEKLHDSSTHPNIKDGDLYVVHVENCLIDGKSVQALGLFKAEAKETFLNIQQEGDSFVIKRSEGFSLEKMDKGCVIFNDEGDKGYILHIFDNTGKAKGANYWMDYFLQANVRRDSKFLTQNTMKNMQDFITKELPKTKEISKQEQIEALNKTLEYVRENDTFNKRKFAETVLPEGVEADFETFLSSKNDGLDDWDQFPISEEAVKKSSKFMKKVIKLDRNFSIYVHGNTEYVEKYFDQHRGMKCYKFYFTDEK